MFVELTGGIVLGVLLAVVSQVVDYVSANSRMFAAKMNEVRRSTAHGPVDGNGVRGEGWGGSVKDLTWH